MVHSVLRFIGTALAVALTVKLVPGISVQGGWETILLVAFVWSLIALIVKPILHILTFPITILTFGLFAFVLNALLFWAMTLIVPGFIITGFWAAFLGALVLSLVTWLIHQVF